TEKKCAEEGGQDEISRHCAEPRAKKVHSLCARTALMSALLLLAGCSFTARVRGTSKPLVNQQGRMFRGLGEMRAQAVPAGTSPGCGAGALVVTSGGGQPPEVLLAALPTGDPLVATPATWSSLNLVSTDVPGTDQHVLRLTTGELYISWLNASTAPLTPQPEWWDVVAGEGSRRGGGGRRTVVQRHFNPT